MQRAVIEINQLKITLFNIYSPNIDNEQINFYNQLLHCITEEKPSDILIVGGDFNLIQNFEYDKKGGNVPKKNSLHVLKNCIEQCELIDIWRDRHKNKREYTWSQNKPKIACRLDYFLIPKVQSNYIKNVYIDTFIMKSDHKPVIIEIDKTKFPKRGPSYWKLNNSLIEDNTYCEEIKQIIDNTWQSNLHMKILSRYEFVKYEILRFSKQYAQKRAKQRRERESILLEQLKEYQENMEQNRNNQQILETYESLKVEYDELLNYKSQGAWVRSRLEKIQLDEKSTKYFFSREKSSFDKKTINILKDENERHVVDGDKILTLLRNYYTQLYKSSYTTPPSYDKIENLQNLPILSEIQKQKLDKTFCIQEFYNALKSF